MIAPLPMPGMDSCHPDYLRNYPRWVKCRNVLSGEDTVKLAGTTYLPKPTGMDDDEYHEYKERAAFVELTSRARDAMLGLVGRKKPTYRVPDSMDALIDDVDYAGSDIDELAFSALTEVMDVGRAGLLVDYPKVDTAGMSLAEVELAGFRPYALLFKAEDILDWREGLVGNSKRLTFVKLRESYEEPMQDFPYSTELEYRLRIYRLVDGICVYELYERDADDWKEEPIDRGVLYQDGRPLTFIPFVPLGPFENSIKVQKPPLLPMANLNVHHYQASADRNHALHYCDLPTPIIRGTFLSATGEQPTSIRLGPTSAIHLQAEGDASFLEMQGNGVTPTRELMEEYVTMMSVLGNKILAMDSKTSEAAETATIQRAGEQAILAAMANNVSRGVEEALEIMAGFLGIDDEDISYQLSTDYLPYAMDSQTLIALIGAVSAGKLSDEEFFEALVAGEMVRPDKTYAQHKEELARMPKPVPITPDSGGTFGLADKGIADATRPNTDVRQTADIDGQARQSLDSNS